jgi:hypothetical protein
VTALTMLPGKWVMKIPLSSPSILNGIWDVAQGSFVGLLGKDKTQCGHS